MTHTATDVAELLRQRLAVRDFEGFANLFAQDGVFEYPFGYPGAPERIEGRARIREHLLESRKHVGALIDITDVRHTVHQTTDPDVVITETVVTGITKATGASFEFASSVGVLTVRDGEVARFRDYTNALGSARVTGRDLTAATPGEQA